MRHRETEAKRFADLIRADLPPVSAWIEPAILTKNGRMLFGAEAKAGKSSVMLELARCLATCEHPFGWDQLWVPRPAKTLVIEQELGELGFRQRLLGAFDKVPLQQIEDYLWYVSKDPEITLSDPGGRHKLRSYIDKVEPDVLVLDPIGMMLGAWDESSATDIAQLFNHLDGILKDYESAGMSYMMSHHFKKPPTGDLSKMNYDTLSKYNFSGSHKWPDAVDTLMTMHRSSWIRTKKPKAWRLTCQFETRHGESPDNVVLSVNKEYDMRVRFEKVVEDGLPRDFKDDVPAGSPRAAKPRSSSPQAPARRRAEPEEPRGLELPPLACM